MFHGKPSCLSCGIQLKQHIWCFLWLMDPFFHSIWLTSGQTFFGFGLTNGTPFPQISNSSGKNSLDIKLLQRCEKGRRLVCDNRCYFFFCEKTLGVLELCSFLSIWIHYSFAQLRGSWHLEGVLSWVIKLLNFKTNNLEKVGAVV